MLYHFSILAPEIILASVILVFIASAAFINDADKAYQLSYSASLLALAACFIAILLQFQWFTDSQYLLFSGQFIWDNLSSYAKMLVLVGTFLVLLIGSEECKNLGMNQFEYPILVLFAVLGMMIMISANHLLVLYIGLELQSLALYVMVAFRRDSIRESEAGLKYFVLGALASGIILYGASLVYGFTGSLGFDAIANNISSGEVAIGAIIGMTFLIAGIAFKLSAVPFHMWTPDVYEGTALPVTSFFANVPKIAAFILFTRLLMTAFIDVAVQWQMVVMLIAMLSMGLACFAAIAQKNIKRLIAYSSIGHMGYALVGLSAGTQEGLAAILVYLTIYMVTGIGLFACILSTRNAQGNYENISDFSGLLQHSPSLAMALLIFMFSMAGIPPMAGFFAKFYVFKAALSQELYLLVIIAALTSVVSAFYYLHIVRIMFFDSAKITHQINHNLVLRMVIFITSSLVLVFALWPAPLIYMVELAASSFFIN